MQLKTKSLGSEAITVHAVQAVVVYEMLCEQQQNEKGYYITQHDIVDGAVREGKPITREGLMRLCKSMIPSLARKRLSFINDEVIAYNCSAIHPTVIWWRRSSAETLYFTENTGIKSGRYPVPPLLFMLKDQSLHVWALGSNQRPYPHTVYYSPPFPNCQGGKVCLGNSEIPESTELDSLKIWESVFFKSTFTEFEEPQLKKITVRDLWKSLKGKKRFPNVCLVPQGKVLDILVKGGLE